ncbi:MAG: hypothetical protein HZB38_05020 [Planctomycetes bacterium]|nr:hypothetical protein [Planctomycetota bacterium]
MVERLIVAHRERGYREIEQLCVREKAADVIATLTAFDEFLDTNQMLCDFVRNEIGSGTARIIDQSELASNLEIFSRFVEIVDIQVEGETSTVAFTVDGRLPARKAQLVRVDGVWRYDPGGGYDPRIPAAFRRMSEGLRLVHEDLRSGRVPLSELRDDPNRLIEDVRLRMTPGAQMIPPPTSAPSP